MDNENRNNWYTPLERGDDSPAGERAAEKMKKGLPLGLRIVLGALLALGLIAGSSLFFSDRSGGEQRRTREQIVIENPFELPLPIPETELPEMPESWEDFFDDYFVPEEDSREACEIPTVSEKPHWELELAKPGVREKSLQLV